MKRFVGILLIGALSVAAGVEAFAQREVREAVRRDAPKEGVLMGYILRGPDDTLFIDNLSPIWVFPKGRKNKKDLKDYYRLVYNFNKVYPYALVAREIVAEADGELDRLGVADRRGGFKRTKYVNNMQDELFDVFEKPLRNMTFSQGKLLVKLIDREIGKSSYDIIKDYKSGVAAKFWQGVASLFDNDLKKRYDPTGDDAVTEYLVEQWELGYFDNLYYSIFYDLPPKVKVPERKKR
ncbi:MAG: DUF4294 domain-containing protein [Bacteroidales bacterium]|nr:DUF4294 domain-containing protein [Bacteroidales bacterium]